MPAHPVNILTFASADKLAENLADEIACSLAKAIQERGQASMVVSGGSTPKLLFQLLSLKKISWQKVTITLADERWVATTDSSSNELLVRSHLLQNNAACAHFIGLKNNAPTAVDGEQACHYTVGMIPRPIDVVILGMGNDGHTASFFPGAEKLNEALDMQSGRHCIAITPPDAPHKRLTLTLPTLLDSREIILHITGDSKKKVLDKVLTEGLPNDMPVRWILKQQQTPVRIFWAP
jgi:6-phosphogluconolactonase